MKCSINPYSARKTTNRCLCMNIEAKTPCTITHSNMAIHTRIRSNALQCMGDDVYKNNRVKERHVSVEALLYIHCTATSTPVAESV